uniref:Uncharacterized protein n=1 Tax=Phaseolus vulgaris TaxID=3885 RepID=V7B340_PHAVU|nr:hypothetical protein PHAVU_008G101700g [Phaseolus vulgaris]ESW12307.1 hypothetical protein PHAVU_008G101700g [Phaseolus vulgaris]
MKKSSGESSTKPNNNSPKLKPPFKPAKDDTKPVLQDPLEDAIVLVFWLMFGSFVSEECGMVVSKWNVW